MKYFETYQEVKNYKPLGLRGQLRRIALDGLSVVDKIKGIENDLKKPRVQFIYLHHIFKDEEQGLHRLLGKLAEHHEFLTYSESVSKVLEGKIDKPYICISSDDGIKSNLRAAEIMNEYNARGCFFINPNIVEEKSFDVIAKHCKERLDFPPVEFMDWKDIERLQKMGHEIGSHTMDHINVAETNKEVFIEDCNKTFEVLKERCGEAKHFAYPYGRFFHFNEMGREVVFDAGFISCASAERGCHVNPNQPLNNRELFIRRDQVILDWNLNHIMYFLAKSARNATPLNNTHTF